MLKRIFNYKPPLLKALVFIVVLPPLVLFIGSLISAMTWRVVADSSIYKVGRLVSFSLTLFVLITFLVLLRFVWVATNYKCLKVRLLSALLSLIILFSYVLLPNKLPPLKRLLDEFNGKVYYLDEVSPESFVKLKQRIDTAIFSPTKIFIGSGGGDLYAGLAIGYLIHEKQLDVQVLDLCASSCANYLFPAGRNKILNKHSIVMYHGNSLQESFVNFIQEYEKVDGDISKLPKVIYFGQKNKELFINIGKNHNMEFDNLTISQQAVFDYLGWRGLATDLEVRKKFIEEEKRFYEKLGVDHKIGIYGQIDDYKKLYKSYQYDGFYYSIDDMKRMGIKPIRVQDGPWQPELNPESGRYYRVSLKN